VLCATLPFGAWLTTFSSHLHSAAAAACRKQCCVAT
jgi:hypothetical protein